ncbi:MAG: ABC transporter ATP-binding protein [Erysipelotrichales bacterium]|nr:ABC transporter ATP-binding protein [Erysipelotrichales bacterium]
MKQTWQNVRDFLKLVKKDYPYAVYVIISNALAKASLPFVNLVYYAKIIDALTNNQYEIAIKYAVLMISLSLALGIITHFTNRDIEMYGYTLDGSLMQQITYKAMVMEYEEFEKTDSMDSIRMAKGKANGAGGAGSQIEYINLFVIQIISIIYSLYFMGKLFINLKYTNFNQAIIWMLILSFMFVGLLIIGNKISKLSSDSFEEMQRKNVHFNSVSSYICYQATIEIKDILLYQLQHLFITYNQSVNKRLGIYIEWGKKNGLYTAIISLCMNIFAATSYIFVGVLAINGSISIGNVLLYAGTIQRFVNYMTGSVTYYNQIRYHADFLNEYSKFINKPNLHYVGTLPIEKRSDNKYEFEFKNVSFKYPNTENYVLKDINLKLNVGDKLAVVGRNGAGKTTLIKLLCRLYEPTEGEILLNGINIGKYDYDEYTTIFSPVFQDFALFSIPLDENVASGLQINNKKLSECLEKVGMNEKVANMSDKEHTLLYRDNGEGVNVSGGEAQKLAIARALYKDAPFVILDEPTAALDPIAEAEVYENFNDLIENKSAIYISHRMSSCKFCDDIVVFKDGEIVERGNHTTLLEKDGEYASLYNAQAEYYA